MTTIQLHVLWCRALFNSLREGGEWAVPRSGLIFTKREGGLVLTDSMPFMAGMPGSAKDLLAYQQDEYDLIREHFESAGIPVSREAV